MSTVINKIKRRLRDIYWFFKDRQNIGQLGINPESYLVFIPRDTDKIFVDVYIRSGISIESDQEFGVGHLLEHYLTEKICQKYAADFYSNARIDHEMIHFYARIDKDKPKELIAQFLDEIFHPVFDDEKIVEYEKLAIQNELNTDSHNLIRKIERLVENHRFAEDCQMIKSFEDSIEPTKFLNITNVAEHYAQIFNRANVKVFISAYGPSFSFISYLRNLFSQYSLPAGSPTVYPPCVYSGRQIIKLNEPTLRGTYVYLTFPAPTSQTRPKDRLVLRLLLDLLAGRNDEFSMNKLARKEGIYSINNYWVRMSNIGLVVFHSYVPKEDISDLLQVMNRSLHLAKDNPVSRAYLNRELQNLQNAFRKEWRSNDRVNWLMEETVDFGHHYDLSFYLQILKSIRPVDLQDMANKILERRHLNLLLYGEDSLMTDEELYAHFDF